MCLRRHFGGLVSEPQLTRSTGPRFHCWLSLPTVPSPTPPALSFRLDLTTRDRRCPITPGNTLVSTGTGWDLDGDLGPEIPLDYTSVKPLVTT